MINAFSQLGNVSSCPLLPYDEPKLTLAQVAGSYVWDLKEDGYRKSYGIVTSMFGITVVGCLVFRMVLSNLNKKLSEQERTWETQPDVAKQTADIIQADDVNEALRLRKGFRYLI
jgi:hypothetical protein